MKTKLLLLFISAICCFPAIAQDNFSGFNYQAVVRDANGNPLPNQSVSLKVHIFAGLSAGYEETHSVSTNDHGLIDLVMGEGTPEVGSVVPTFDDLDWETGSVMNYDISIDITGGTNYQPMGSGTFKSVPFALHALTTNSSGGVGWSLNGNDLSNTNSGNVGIGTSTPSTRLTVSGYFGIGTLLNLEQVTNSWGSPATFTAHRYIQTNSAAQDGYWKQFNVGAGGVSIGFPEVPDYASTDALYVNGSVGIGTNSPTARLDVATGAIRVVGNQDTHSQGTYLEWNKDGGSGYGYLLNNKGGGGGGWVIGQVDNANNITTELFIQPNTHNVGIGTTNPQSKLSVNGKITCKEVEVTLSGFPDYVFEVDYDLMTLEEVEAYIKEHGHLPNVPSATEVEENGLGLGEMNKILLEKVEELTLYLLEKDELFNELIVRIELLELENNLSKFELR